MPLTYLLLSDFYNHFAIIHIIVIFIVILEVSELSASLFT